MLPFTIHHSQKNRKKEMKGEKETGRYKKPLADQKVLAGQNAAGRPKRQRTPTQIAGFARPNAANGRGLCVGANTGYSRCYGEYICGAI
jgi:hypothetical protein